MNEMDVPTGGGWENLVLLLALAGLIGIWEVIKGCFLDWRRRRAAMDMLKVIFRDGQPESGVGDDSRPFSSGSVGCFLLLLMLAVGVGLAWLGWEHPVEMLWICAGWAAFLGVRWLRPRLRRAREIRQDPMFIQEMREEALKRQKRLADGCGVCLMWGWVIGWTAGTLYAALEGHGWMLAFCGVTAAGSWSMLAWWKWYSQGGRW